MSKNKANTAVSRHIRIMTAKHGGDWQPVACEDCGVRSRALFHKFDNGAKDRQVIFCKPCLLLEYPEDCEIVVEPIEVNE